MLIQRKSMSGSGDLHVIYRPYTLSEMLGNVTNVNSIKNDLDANTVPHSYLFSGHTGCGKTTAARIVSMGLNCEKGVSSKPCMECRSCVSILNNNHMDVVEINVGSSGTKGDVTEATKNLNVAPWSGRYKILIFDEAHKLTAASQDLLLKKIEDGFSHVYFIFCTNEPQKLKTTFSNRCYSMTFDRMPIDLVHTMLVNVCEFEGWGYNNDVLSYIAEESKGVPRDALVWLKQVNSEMSWSVAAAKSIVGILIDEEDPQIIELSRVLIKGEFKKAITIYGKLNIAAESVRMATAGYFVSCLKRTNSIAEARNFSKILDIVTVPIYDPGKLGDHKFINCMFKISDICRK